MPSELFEFIFQGESDAVEQCLEERPELLHSRDQVGNSLLSAAIQYKQWAVLRYLLEKGAGLQADTSILTAIVAGVLEQQREMAVLLSELVVDQGLDVNLPLNQRGETMLMAAAAKGSLDIVRALLRLGADLHRQDKDGATALSRAYLNYQIPTVRLLLTSGAKTSDAVMEVYIACTLGDLDHLKYVLAPIENVREFINTCKYGFHEESLFRRACNCNHLDIVQYLIDLGADVNTQYSGRYTMLMFAAGSGHLELVRCLIRNGANVDKQNEYGWTALMYATMENRVEVVRYLLGEGANLNLRTHLNQSIFSLSNSEEVNNLLNQHMSVASKRKLDWTEWYHIIVEGATWG